LFESSSGRIQDTSDEGAILLAHVPIILLFILVIVLPALAFVCLLMQLHAATLYALADA
jgi:hypothetical protein